MKNTWDISAFKKGALVQGAAKHMPEGLGIIKEILSHWQNEDETQVHKLLEIFWFDKTKTTKCLVRSHSHPLVSIVSANDKT